jgi:hypothetical protein
LNLDGGGDGGLAGPKLTVKALFASCPVSLRLYASIYSEH